jgi:hypothetical protein
MRDPRLRRAIYRDLGMLELVTPSVECGDRGTWLKRQDDTLRIWSLLQTRWLDVPIGRDVRSANPTWGAFSEAFESCLLGVSLHVGRRVNDRAGLESVVTEVFIENLDILASPLGEREKLDRLLAASDLLLAKRAPTWSDAGSRDRDVTIPGDVCDT